MIIEKPLPKTVELTEDMEDILSSGNEMEDGQISQIKALRFLSLLDTPDQVLVLMLMLGYQQVEVATVLGCSEAWISQRLTDVRTYAKIVM
jgi:DNA-directed RNA polymerase specialized sigma24 family protein